MLSSGLACLLPLLLPAVPADLDSPPSRVILRVPWGQGPESFGVEQHGARRGPSALAAANGRLYVLDALNARVRVFSIDSGQLLADLPTGTKTSDFLAVDASGRILVMDAFVRREVRELNAGQAPRIQSLPKRGRALPSEVFATPGGFQVEWDHGVVTQPGAKDAEERALPGRPTKFGWVRAARSRAGVDLLLGHRETARPQLVRLEVSGGMEALLALGSDARGNVLVAGYPQGDEQRRIQVFVISPRGRTLASFTIPDQSITDIYTRLFLAPDGRLYQLRTDTEGVEVREWLWRPASEQKGGER